MFARKRLSGSCQRARTCIALSATLFVGVSQNAFAQIVPDNTLGTESSVVMPNTMIRGIESDRIDGGVVRGTNLFHSFEQFNIGAGRGAYFTNPLGIDNILSRVTGANRSEILGRIGVLGSANLFLINPQGIVFGSDASLDVQGSFLATTANAVKLGEIGLFSASQPATSNLLSVSPSAFWFNAVAAQSIVNRSQAQSNIGQPNSIETAPGLQVQPGRSLALIGGDVRLEGGRLNAAEGRIELGSVAGIGSVSLSQSGTQFVLGYDSIQNFGTIALSNEAFVDVSGERGGDIQIRGARLEMGQNSSILSDTLGAEKGGEVLVRTTEIVLSGNSRLSATASDTATGTGGNLSIETGRLSVRGGAQVSTKTTGAGQGGRLQINASDSIEVSGASEVLPDDFFPEFPSGLLTESQGSGDAGELKIDTGRLIVQDGAVISTGTFLDGKGGKLQIKATDSIELLGALSVGIFRTGLFSGGGIGSGDAGELSIDTQRLIVRDGAVVSTRTFGDGQGGRLQINASDAIEVSGTTADGQLPGGLFTESFGDGAAGELRIDTGRLIVQDGAAISTANAFSAGEGGSLQINATDAIEISGIATNGIFRAGGGFPSGLFTESQGSGNAGNLRLETGRLQIRDGAVISSRSQDVGKAGNINITVRDRLQANRGTIRTDSAQTQGGAVTIRAEAILLFDKSDIRSTVASGADNGGNITISAGSILAFDDSDILAFSRDGRGGNITLDTPAFFGENYRPASSGVTLDSLDNNHRVDVNATGAISGSITLPDVSFIQNSLTELPDNQVNTDTLLASSCIVRRARPTQGSFTITGTGGLPQRPGEAQASSFPTVSIETPSNQPSNPSRTWRKGDPIVEPQGVYRLPNGKILLSRNCG